jgi:hypothetical protein
MYYQGTVVAQLGFWVMLWHCSEKKSLNFEDSIKFLQMLE